MTEKNKNSQKKLPGLFVRQQAAKALDYVLEGNSFEPLSAEQIEDSRDRALANRLVNTALRRHGHLNEIIEKLMQRGVPKRAGLFEAILRIGLVQLIYLEDMGAHSAIHLAVEAAKQDQRAARFDRVLNGVLRQAQRESAKWKALDNSLLFPVWLTKRWRKTYGVEAFGRFGKALLAGAPLDLTLKKIEPKTKALLGGKELIFDSIRIETRDRPVRELEGYEQGKWWVQDVAATLPARLFSLPSGAKVLDMCAAPGGKTAQLVKDKYEVTALDNSPGRIKRLTQNLERLNYEVEMVEADAKTYQPAQKFDGVLIDAPCTATGTFRRHPEVIWHRDYKDISNRVKLQKGIILNGVQCLKSGGELILCVCSLQEEEGERQAHWVSESFPQLAIVPITAKEIGDIKGAISPEGWVRTHPGMDVGPHKQTSMDGFFVARWRLI